MSKVNLRDEKQAAGHQVPGKGHRTDGARRREQGARGQVAQVQSGRERAGAKQNVQGEQLGPGT